MDFIKEKKQADALRLRVVSYNVKHGKMVSLDMSVLAEDILSVDPDVVGLQEIDIGTDRVEGRDTLRTLAEAAGFEYYRFCSAMDYRGGKYGTAIMSHYPICAFEAIALPCEEGLEPRAVGHAVLDIRGTLVDFFNTHLSYERISAQAMQFCALGRLIAPCACWVLTGDFNTGDVSRFAPIGDAVMVNDGRYPTECDNGASIDNILADPAWRVAESGMVDSRGHTDHHMLWAELIFEHNSKKGLN